MRQGILALREPLRARRGGHGRLCPSGWMAQFAVPGGWEVPAGAGGAMGLPLWAAWPWRGELEARAARFAH